LRFCVVWSFAFRFKPNKSEIGYCTRELWPFSGEERSELILVGPFLSLDTSSLFQPFVLP
jgi:hypothetical protein